MVAPLAGFSLAAIEETMSENKRLMATNTHSECSLCLLAASQQWAGTDAAALQGPVRRACLEWLPWRGAFAFANRSPDTTVCRVLQRRRRWRRCRRW